MSAKTITYFAYGSNMSERRLRERGVSAKLVFSAKLDGYELRFDKVSKRDGSGKCHVVQANASEFVYGAVFEIAFEDQKALDDAEGCGKGYDRQEVIVVTPQGTQVSAFTYIATNIDEALRPFTWYMRHVLEGARALGLPTAYINWLEAVPATQDPDKERERRELSIYFN